MTGRRAACTHSHVCWMFQCGGVAYTPTASSVVVQLAASYISKAPLMSLRHRGLFDDLQLGQIVTNANESHVPIFLCHSNGHTHSLSCVHDPAGMRLLQSAPRASWMSRASRVVPERCNASSQANAARFSTKSSATSCSTCAHRLRRKFCLVWKTQLSSTPQPHLLGFGLEAQLGVDGA